MAFTKYASLESAEVLGIKGSVDRQRLASLDKFADFEDYRTEDGYLYARIRAISSRVNKNHDGWPSIELAGGDEIFDRISKQAGFAVEAMYCPVCSTPYSPPSILSSQGKCDKCGYVHKEPIAAPAPQQQQPPPRKVGFTVEADSNHSYGYSTFLGKPIFVDHHNSDPSRARGVIVDAKLHVDDHKTASDHDPYYASAPDNHMPPTWVELLLEVDAKSFPRLAKAIIEGSQDSSKGIDGFSMGCDVEKSICNICKNSATLPDEYCEHIRNKGAEYDWINPKTGHKESKKSYEDCYGIKFFEISAVFDPADETALLREVRASKTAEHESNFMKGSPDAGDDQYFGGKPGSAKKAFDSMIDQYGKEKGEEVYYATRNKHKKKGSTDVNEIVEKLGVDLNEVDINELSEGIKVEAEHSDTVGDDPLIHAKIALDHLKELPDYYTKLKEIEKTAGPALGYGDRPVACPDCNGYGSAGGVTCSTCGGDGYAVDHIQGDDGAMLKADREQDASTWGIEPSFFPESRPSQGVPHLNKTAAPTPQAELIKAPDEVDTLREEIVCPVCGSDMDEETCEVCGYIRPPEGFDTPDLTKAQDSDLKQEGGDVGLDAEGGPESEGTSNSTTFAHVNNDVSWEITSAYTNPDKETVVVPGSGPASDEPTEQIIRDQKAPVTSTVRTAKDFIAAAGANETRRQMSTHTADAASGAPAVATPDKNVDTEGVGGVLDASNEAASEADAQVDVGAQGGTGVEGVSADSTTNVDQGDEHSKNIEAIPTKTFDDGSSAVERQESPVGGDVFPPSDEGVKAASWEVTATDDSPYPTEDGGLGGGSANPGVQPADPVGVADERVNVLDHVTSPSNNSGPTETWSGTDGNSVLRQQEPVTTESLEGEDLVNLKTTHIYTAFKLADLEVDLGLINKDRKYARISELEQKTPEQLIEALATTQRIKQAGLAKGQKTARRMPSLARTNQEKETQKKSSGTNEFQSDAQLFL